MYGKSALNNPVPEPSSIFDDRAPFNPSDGSIPTIRACRPACSSRYVNREIR